MALVGRSQSASIYWVAAIAPGPLPSPVRFPAMQMHTLLGVGGSTAALTAAGDGLLTNIVRAAAKFVLQATKERTGRRALSARTRLAALATGVGL
jgi:hypothetical protein